MGYLPPYLKNLDDVTWNATDTYVLQYSSSSTKAEFVKMRAQDTSYDGVASSIPAVNVNTAIDYVYSYAQAVDAITATGLLVPTNDTIQNALHQIDQYVQNLEEAFEQHQHDERYQASGKVARVAALNHTTSGTWNLVTFDTPHISGRGVTVANSSAPLTCISSGSYVVTATSAWINNATGSRGHRIVHRNSAGTLVQYAGVSLRPGSGSTFSDAATSDIINMQAGDYIQLETYQDAAASLAMNVGSGTYLATLGMSKQ